jgi:hypothetical protein
LGKARIIFYHVIFIFYYAFFSIINIIISFTVFDAYQVGVNCNL